MEGMSRNQKVIVADGCSGTLEVCPDSAELDGGRRWKVQHLQGSEKLSEGKLVGIGFRTVGDSKLKFAEGDGRDTDVADGKVLETLVETYWRPNIYFKVYMSSCGFLA